MFPKCSDPGILHRGTYKLRTDGLKAGVSPSNEYWLDRKGCTRGATKGTVSAWCRPL